MTRVRDELIDALRRELVGPAPGFPAMQLNGEELLHPDDPPTVRYGAGILFPARIPQLPADTSDAAENTDSRDTEPETSSIKVASQLSTTGVADPRSDDRGDSQPEDDPEVNRTNDFMPSALGLTTLIEVPDVIEVSVSCAQYHALQLDSHRGSGATTRSPRKHWLRTPLQETVQISAAELLDESNPVFETPLNVSNTGSRLALHVYARKSRSVTASAKTRFVTITLINRTEGAGRPENDQCFFQCGFSAQGKEEELCFLDYPEHATGERTSAEEQSGALLYRHRKVFAVGHGCATDWTAPDNTGSRCSSVSTATLPVYEVRPIQPVSLSGVSLSMWELAVLEDDALQSRCRDVANHYSSWIDEKAGEISGSVTPELTAAAEANLDACRSCLERIRRGVLLLEKNATAMQAFRAMNESMVMQHEHYQLASDSELRRGWVKSDVGIAPSRPYTIPAYAQSTREWRPFQLAFVLMTLCSITEENDDELNERDLVDLIWFPTGGGKTEAYLGLAAFTIFYRRLINPHNGGCTVLMRYTLRLLTTQQFQRAASLICACEVLRRKNTVAYGDEPVSIGLWVGGGVTPNKEKKALEDLRYLEADKKRENPFIVLSCPWCGVQMGPVQIGTRTRLKGYKKKTGPNRVRLICDDPDCDYNHGEGLPLKVIDEHIYSEPPTLVIGTVDKFAMLPWLPNARSLFGLHHDKYDPPELIIQDELHLISGPLGSMVGHYETVIDALCTKETPNGPRHAKVVASTATISRADDQIRRLYGGRGSCLFPPQGLKAGDSFFAAENPNAAGRLYCGVFATGLPSLTTTQVRVLGSLLQAPLQSGLASASAIDPYWTLMVYFNSIRELGHAATLIKADIPEYIGVLARRLGLAHLLDAEGKQRRRWINQDMELTSRIQNSEITECMERLFTRYTGDAREKPIDVCLATNMIQVGLDVSRLSLMSIIGQPKTTAEYIQASSRVGRSAEGPGLVVTILSPSKPRDRSHVEHFKSFHQSVYRYVEPTSVTPFAIPVTERALHAIVISLVRFWGDDNQRKKPLVPPTTLEKRVRETILQRVERVEPEELDRVESLLDEIFSEWERLPLDLYGGFSITDNEVPMMYPAGQHPDPLWRGMSRRTPSSMRNVDANCNASAIAIYQD